MKILIIENVWMGKTKYKLFDKTILTAFSLLPTLYARQIAAITPKEHQLKLINERYEKINFSKTYDIVNINYTTSTATRAYDIAKIFKQKGWNKYKIVPSIDGIDSIVESILVDDPDFKDLDELTNQIEKKTLRFIDDIEKFLS